ALAVDPEPTCERTDVLMAEHRVLPQRCREQQPVAMAVGGDVADALVASVAGRLPGDVLAGELDASGGDVGHSEDHVDQLGLAVPFDAGHTDDLAAPDAEGDVVQRVTTADGQRNALQLELDDVCDG